MSRVLWLVAIAMIVAGSDLHFAQHEQLSLAGIVLVSGLVIRHLCQKYNFASRLMGQWWRGLIGVAGFAFGAAIVLPALARTRAVKVTVRNYALS